MTAIPFVAAAFCGAPGSSTQNQPSGQPSPRRSRRPCTAHPNGFTPWLLVLPLAIAGPAWAQEQPAPSGTSSLAPVTVTGKKSDRPGQSAPNLATGVDGSAMDTPFATTSVPGERVREQAGTTLQDALRNVPGAQADTGFNGSHTQFFILRGAVTDSGTGSNRVLRDGVRLSNYPYVPAFVESVNVLRGPGAAIGVRSEPGGTVDILTRQPQPGNFGSLYLGAGSDDAREFSLDLNRELWQEQGVAARLIVTRSDASRWRHVPDRLDGVKLGIAKLGGERWHLGVGFEATNQRYQPDYGIPALNGRPVEVSRDRQLGEPFDDSTTRNRIVDLHGDVALGDATRLAAAYTHLEAASTSIRNVLFGSPLAGQPPGTYARITAWEPDTTRRINSVSTSLTRRQTLAGLDHQLYAGIDHYTETLDQPTLTLPASTSSPINVFAPVYGRVMGPPPGVSLPTTLTTEDLRATGVSVQDKVDLDAWSLVAGVRFDHQTFRFGTAAVLPVTESIWSPKLAVLYRPGADHTVYANFSKGTSPNQVSSAGSQSLPSRRAQQEELGWKALWRGGRLISELAIYRLDQTHLISADPLAPRGVFAFTDTGAARSQGLEASLTGTVFDRLNIAATYAYTDANYRENAVFGFNRVPNVARHTLNLWGRYSWDAAWASGANVYLQSRRFADEANTTVLPGYARLDLVQSWQTPLGGDRSIELQLALRNVFDKDYDVSSHLHVSRWITPGQGRNVLLAGTLRF